MEKNLCVCRRMKLPGKGRRHGQETSRRKSDRYLTVCSFFLLQSAISEELEKEAAHEHVCVLWKPASLQGSDHTPSLVTKKGVSWLFLTWQETRRQKSTLTLGNHWFSMNAVKICNGHIHYLLFCPALTVCGLCLSSPLCLSVALVLPPSFPTPAHT